MPGLGAVFPGISHDLLLTHKNRTKQSNQTVEDPKLDVGPIYPDGKIKVEFNQDMLFPNSLTPSQLKFVFVFSLKSDEDGSVTFGRIVMHDDLAANKTSLVNGSTTANRTLLQLVNDTHEEVELNFKDKSFNVTVENI